MRILNLKEKEVINVCDCKRLGFVEDVNIDPCTGCVKELIVPEHNRMFCLFGEEFEYVIPWCCVRQLGDDIILVEVKTKEVRKPCN